MIPKNAILESVVDYPDGNYGIAIYDVSKILALEADILAEKAKKNGKRRKKPFGVRDPRKIDTVIVHKSGANGPAGFEGCRSTMSFVVYHRGWEGAAYTFWISQRPDYDDKNRIVVYRMQPDNVRSWHTGGRMNKVGIGIGVQGNYDSDWDLLANGLPKIDKQPSPEQMIALELLLDYLHDRYNIQYGKFDDGSDYGLTGHWEHGKLCCPGDALRAYVVQRRTGKIERGFKIPSPALPEHNQKEVDPYRFSSKEYQTALKLLGYNPGPIDGIVGEKTRAALERFQRTEGLNVDGWYGHNTAYAMKLALERANILLLEEFTEKTLPED
jgi:hypothetical protein